MYEMIIVGAGPAGLSAAVYAARKRLRTLLVSVDIGGQANRATGVENYMGYQFIEGTELVSKFHSQVSQYPIEQKIGYKVTQVKQVDGAFDIFCEDGDKQRASVIVFTAGKSARELNAPGEKEFAGRGVTYCAVCDGPIFAGQRVAVIGGGNSALTSALDLVRIAKHVDLISLTPLTADPILIERFKEAPNTSVLTEYSVERIEGHQFVEGVMLKSLKTGEIRRLDVTGVFVEIGLAPNSKPVKDLVELNELGEIVITCNCETSQPGLYAAGDVTNVPEKQIVIAAGEGAKAALQAHRYMQRMTR